MKWDMWWRALAAAYYVVSADHGGLPREGKLSIDVFDASPPYLMKRKPRATAIERWHLCGIFVVMLFNGGVLCGLTGLCRAQCMGIVQNLTYYEIMKRQSASRISRKMSSDRVRKFVVCVCVTVCVGGGIGRVLPV